MTLIERIDRGIERLKTEGWTRFILKDSQGYCVRGALMDTPRWAMGWGMDGAQERENEEEIRPIARAMGFSEQPSRYTVTSPEGVMVNWNNTIARDRNEVITRLEAAKAVIALNELTAQSQVDGSYDDGYGHAV